MEKLNIALVIGSTREGRFSEHAAAWLKEVGAANDALNIEIIDIRDYHFPLIGEAATPSSMKGMYPHPEVARWAEKMKHFDGYIFTAAEYNHGYTAALKNALDVIYGEWKNKPVAFVAYGTVGGARAVEQLRLVAIELQMAPIRNAVHITTPWLLREEDGTLTPHALDPYVENAQSMLTQLTWWAKTLRQGRVNV